MTYLPRPDADRTGQDVDELYALAAEELQKATSPETRRKTFRQILLRTYEAGVDAQREVFQQYPHTRPTPVPPPPAAPAAPDDADDPGTLPPAPRGAFGPRRRT